MSDSTTLLGPTSTALGPLQSFRCTRFGVVCDDGGATPDAMNELGPKSKCHPSDTSPYLAQISAYAQFLKDLKTDPNSVIVAGIMGTTEPFAIENRSLPNSSTLLRALAHSCTYIGGLQQVGDLLKTVLVGDPCIKGPLADLSPETAGIQDDCAVSVVTNRGTPTQHETVLPRCTPEDGSATNQPCWRLAIDPASCPNSSLHLMLKVEGQAMLPSDAHVIASCVIEPN
jgi:hypothetical protein